MTTASALCPNTCSENTPFQGFYRLVVLNKAYFPQLEWLVGGPVGMACNHQAARGVDAGSSEGYEAESLKKSFDFSISDHDTPSEMTPVSFC